MPVGILMLITVGKIARGKSGHWSEPVMCGEMSISQGQQKEECVGRYNQGYGNYSNIWVAYILILEIGNGNNNPNLVIAIKVYRSHIPLN